MGPLKTHASVVPLALAAAAGRLGAEELGLPFQACCLAAFVLLHRSRGRRRPLPRSWGAALALTVGALLCVPTLPPPNRLPSGAGFVEFRGRISEEPTRGSYGRQRARLSWAGTDLSLWCRGASPSLPGGGTVVAGRGWFEPAPGAVSGAPVLHVYGSRLRQHPGPWTLIRLKSTCVRAIESSVRSHLGPRHASLVLRLVLGRGEDLDPADGRNHRRLGLAHLLAISGMHTVLVAHALGAVIGLLVRRQRVALVVLATSLLAYAWLTGFRPPVTRAVCGYVVWRWCREAGHSFSLAAAMATAGLVTTLLFPEDLFSPSFCLSYMAVIGLGALTRPLLAGRRHRRGLAGFLRSGFAASVAAQIATAPLCLVFFGCIAPWGIVLTPLAFAVVATMLGLALVAIPLASALPPLAVPLFAAVDALATVYLATLQELIVLPLSPLHPLGIPPAGMAPAVLVICTGLAGLMASRRLFLCGCLTAAGLFFLPWAPSSRTAFVLLNVGHGQAALTLSPTACYAVDCGDSVGGGRAASRLAHELRAARHPGLDHLVLTHCDTDHVSGLAELLLRVPVGRVWLPETPTSGPTVARLARHRIPFTVMRPGDEAVLASQCRVLACHTEADLTSDNDGALLVDYRFQPGPRIIVPGDQEQAGVVAAVARLGPGTQCDVLVLPHHGAVFPHLGDLLELLDPLVCLASTSVRRSTAAGFRSPHLRGWAPLTTGRSGDLRVEISPNGFEVRPVVRTPRESSVGKRPTHRRR